MNVASSRPLRAGAGFVLALALALLSSFIQREGPELETYGNLCGTLANEACYMPALEAGFPFAYLFDQPGVSVERQLSFGEDNVHPAALALDIAVYWSAILLALWFARRVGATLHRIKSEA